MYYIELVKRIVPFFLTFVVGMIITSFIFSIFSIVSPANVEVIDVRFQKQTVERDNYDYSKHNCRKWKRMKRMKEERERKFNLDVPPPPPAPPAPPAPPVAPEK
jgi:hypothetical protein